MLYLILNQRRESAIPLRVRVPRRRAPVRFRVVSFRIRAAGVRVMPRDRRAPCAALDIRAAAIGTEVVILNQLKRELERRHGPRHGQAKLWFRRSSTTVRSYTSIAGNSEGRCTSLTSPRNAVGSFLTQEAKARHVSQINT